MDPKALLGLWKLDEIPACNEGMVLAQAFVVSCGRAVDGLGVEEPSDRITDMNTCYTALVEDGDGCDKCNEA
jgi:hypothetical protein